MNRPRMHRPHPDTKQGRLYKALADSGTPMTVGQLHAALMPTGTPVTQRDVTTWLWLMARRYPTVRRVARATYQVVAQEAS